MSETQVLFGILVLLYLSDAVVWIRSVSVLFHQGWAGGFSHRDSSPFGNANGGLFLLNPLPWNSAYFAYWTPLSLSPAGICNFGLSCPGRSVFHSASRDWLAFRDIKSATAEEKNLLINGRVFSKCGTPREARRLAGLITRLGTLGEDQRAKAIRDHLASALSHTEAKDRHAVVRKAIAPVRLLSSVFFILLLAVTPLSSVFFSLDQILWPLLATTLVCVSAIALAYFRADTILNPERRIERIGNVVKMIFCPPVAIRATDLLTLDSMADFHPLLVASVLFETKPTDYYGEVIRDYLHPLAPKPVNPAAIAIATWYSTAKRETVMALFKAQFPQLHGEIIQAPKGEGAARSYCPRCLSQFTRSDGFCSDCVGIHLIEFPQEPARP